MNPPTCCELCGVEFTIQEVAEFLEEVNKEPDADKIVVICGSCYDKLGDDVTRYVSRERPDADHETGS